MGIRIENESLVSALNLNIKIKPLVGYFMGDDQIRRIILNYRKTEQTVTAESTRLDKYFDKSKSDMETRDYVLDILRLLPISNPEISVQMVVNELQSINPKLPPALIEKPELVSALHILFPPSQKP